MKPSFSGHFAPFRTKIYKFKAKNFGEKYYKPETIERIYGCYMRIMSYSPCRY